MKTLSLVIIALLALPFAAADQTISAGPAEAKTQSVDQGDGCDSDSGYSWRHVGVEVEATEDESVVASASQWCNTDNRTWTDPNTNEQHYQRWQNEGGQVFVGRTSDGNPGPAAWLFYSDSRYEDSWGGQMHWCGSGLYASGPSLFTGCYPDGGRWPMLPALP